MIIVATTSLPAVERPNADRWNAACLCQYFRVALSGQFLESIKFYFRGTGYDLLPEIGYVALKGYIDAKDIRAVRFVSKQVKSPDQRCLLLDFWVLLSTFA